jgi:hypothetical protein
MMITYPWEAWEGPDEMRVCAGSFWLAEPDGDPHEGFSFGGQLKIRNQESFTVCSLSSPAPIFNLRGDPDAAGELLVDEFQALLAKRSASYGEDDSAFGARLENVDPFTLFIASVAALKAEIELLPSSVRSHGGYRQQLTALNQAIETLEAAGEWPGRVPTLEELI